MANSSLHLKNKNMNKHSRTHIHDHRHREHNDNLFIQYPFPKQTEMGKVDYVTFSRTLYILLCVYFFFFFIFIFKYFYFCSQFINIQLQLKSFAGVLNAVDFGCSFIHMQYFLFSSSFTHIYDNIIIMISNVRHMNEENQTKLWIEKKKT